MSAFAVYLLGITICVVGILVAAYLLGVPVLWIAIAATALLIIAVVIMKRRLSREP